MEHLQVLVLSSSDPPQILILVLFEGSGVRGQAGLRHDLRDIREDDEATRSAGVGSLRLGEGGQ